MTPERPETHPSLAWFVSAALLAAMAMTACSDGASPGASHTPSGPASAAASGVEEPSGTVNLYTSVTQDTVDAVLAAFAEAHPDVSVEVFRAPTGELDARIASERRSGRIGADVLWGTDPLSMQVHAAEGLFRTWTPDEAAAIPDEYHTDTFWGTRILNMIMVHGAGVTPPTDWSDLTDAAYAGSVAIPDPGFAGSAFGALAYFASSPEYGMDYYRQLKANGAVQLQAIPEVLTNVAEGIQMAGITLDKVARDAMSQGSPVELVWPESGAIAIYSPIAILNDADNASAAESFANFVLTRAGQEAIASTGWQPIRDDVSGGPPVGGRQVAPDWEAVFEQQEGLLEEYRSIFGG